MSKSLPFQPFITVRLYYVSPLLRFIYPTSCGVLCLDIHPAHPHLLAVGLYDGSVCVYNLRHQESREPDFRSTAGTGKHTDPVWQVHVHVHANSLFSCLITTSLKLELGKKVHVQNTGWKLMRSLLSEWALTQTLFLD